MEETLKQQGESESGGDLIEQSRSRKETHPSKPIVCLQAITHTWGGGWENTAVDVLWRI